MTHLLARTALAVSSSAELSIILKATVVLGLTLIGTWCARCARASVRHVVLASAFGVLLTLPVVAVLMPPLAVALPVALFGDSSAADAPRAAGAPGRIVGRNHARLDTADGAGDATSASAQRPSLPISTLLRIGWGTGVMLFLTPVAVALSRLRRLRRRGRPWLKAEPATRTTAEQAGIRRPVDVLLDHEITVPLTCGFARPAIVLPSDAEAWAEADVRQAIVHELEHVHRADWPVQLVARVVCALYWFHPLVWVAWHRLSNQSAPVTMRSCGAPRAPITRNNW
jgi:beta-lactamase regulating signal transducer with metallopeptidase domain